MTDSKVYYLVLIALMVVCVNCAPIDESEKNDKEQFIDRSRRSVYPWSPAGESENYQRYESFSVWRPPVYQLSRPYYIPIYGVSGKIPMYFPPQPLHPFRGPPYLPPEMPKESDEDKSTEMKIKNRFNDDDDRPVWGGYDVNTPKSVPQMPAYPPAVPSFPPLIHDIREQNKPAMHLAAETDKIMSSIEDIFGSPMTTTTTRATPTTPRPMTTTPVSTTTSVPGPSNCVWAVISCCSLDTEVVSEKCFEQRGCPGPFWDTSPCNKEYAKSALDTVMKYYGSRMGV